MNADGVAERARELYLRQGQLTLELALTETYGGVSLNELVENAIVEAITEALRAERELALREALTERRDLYREGSDCWHAFDAALKELPR